MIKLREFKKQCRIHFGKRKKGEEDLTELEKHDMLLYCVRYRMPVHNDFVTELLDWSWIHSCAYLNKGKNFLYTDEQYFQLSFPNYYGEGIKEW
jgi:hypothetical protein